MRGLRVGRGVQEEEEQEEWTAKGYSKDSFRVMKIFYNLLVAMVSQVHTLSKLVTLYTLNGFSLLDIKLCLNKFGSYNAL